MIDPHIFRAYDIRGKAHSQISSEACELIGKGFGSTLRELYNTEHPTVVVGRDARTHGPELMNAVVRGLTSTGCKVLLIGQTPSPVNYFTICNQNFDGGIQVTASHNPAEDNGLKLQIRHAEAYAGDNLQMLKKKIEAGDFVDGKGSTEERDGVTPYLAHVHKLFGECGKGMHVVIDAGNGVAGPAYTEALKQAGCTVTELYTEPDGTFPNHPADPSKHETLTELQSTVADTGAALGFAFDGDGDRLGLVDEQGNIKTADDILLLLAQDHLGRHKGMPVIFTVSNSGALKSEIENWGGKPVMCKVGHSFVEHAMTEHKALLGGEQSGHFFCGEDYFSYDDALVAALRVLKIASEHGGNFSELFSNFPAVYQSPEQRPHCDDDKKSDVIRRTAEHFAKDYECNTLDGVRIEFGNGAWAGIRQSNTSPKISICMEARSPEKLNEIEGIVLGHLQAYPEIDWNKG